jgi:hypothetical protein
VQEEVKIMEGSRQEVNNYLINCLFNLRLNKHLLHLTHPPSPQTLSTPYEHFLSSL